MYKFLLKRVIDFILSVIGLILLSPIFVAILILLIVYNRGKPFFFQERPGEKEKIFKVIKFKTMNDKKDDKGNLLPDELRLTNVGDFVRKTSLDEIPQLLNVLKGDMSLIGPRPLLVEYLPLYNKEQKRRHDVKPGITGLAQINGRNAITWNKKFEYDIEYVDEFGFFLDLEIFFKTFFKVLKSEGINKEGEVTTTKFLGNE